MSVINRIHPSTGDRIKYRCVFGKGPAVEATVTSIDNKNDERIAGLDNGHWCYFHQIDKIIIFAADSP